MLFKRHAGAVIFAQLCVFCLIFVHAFLPPFATSKRHHHQQQHQHQTPFIDPHYCHNDELKRQTSTQLCVSSIRTWLSFVTPGKNSKKTATLDQKQKISSVFFKRQPHNPHDHNQTHSKHTSANTSVTADYTDNSTIIDSETSPTTWADILNEENETIPFYTNLSENKRQSLQYGIFAPSPSRRSFPEYTSAWANTLSSTIHNTTSSAWNKMAFTPMQISVPVPVPSAVSPNSSLQALGIPSYLRPTDTVTVADLQAILERNALQQQQSRSSPLGSSSMRDSATAQSEPQSSSQSLSAPVTPTRKSKQGVAFPKPSVLDYKSLQRGTAVASALAGMVVAATLLPNLWLMGLIAGAIYGNDICSRPDEPPPTNLLARTLIGWGRGLARVTLQFLDHCRTLWFLYKTGQLSYQYYKQYEAIDQRFAIQSKIDAWNSRFQEGKQQFDKWEQENEIGRTVLAGLRTIWLVDEQAKRRAKQKSRYRLVQYLYDTKYWIGRWYRKTWKALRVSTWNESFRDFLEGIRTDLMKSTGGSWGTRLWAVVASLIAVNITGALFAISPSFLALLAIGVGIAWPSWVSELAARINTLTIETRARGRGEETPGTDFAFQQLNTARLLGRYDKSKYHFFRRENGTKRYYRTGQSLFQGRRKDKVQSKPSTLLAWPWAKPQRLRRPPGKEQWGVFFQEYKSTK